MSLGSLDQSQQSVSGIRYQGVRHIRYTISLAILCPESCGNGASTIPIRLKAQPEAESSLGCFSSNWSSFKTVSKWIGAFRDQPDCTLLPSVSLQFNFSLSQISVSCLCRRLTRQCLYAFCLSATPFQSLWMVTVSCLWKRSWLHLRVSGW